LPDEISFVIHANSQKSKTFTIIELMAVVMVIGVLFAMLLPSLSHARERARQGVCIGSLKQLGLSIRSYGIDHAGWFPNQHTAVSNATAEPKFALDRLIEEGYLTSGRVFKCPSTKQFDTRLDTDDHIVDPSFLYLGDWVDAIPIFVENAVLPDSSIMSDRLENHVTRNRETFYGNIAYQDGRVEGFLGPRWYLEGDISVDMQSYIQTENDAY